jgi:hypothetical protein
MARQPLGGLGRLIFRGFTITLFRHTTICRTPLHEWSARRRDFYQKTHNTHKRQTSMPPAGFEPTILVSERPQTHTLYRTATGIGVRIFSLKIHIQFLICNLYHRPQLNSACRLPDRIQRTLEFVWTIFGDYISEISVCYLSLSFEYIWERTGVGYVLIRQKVCVRLPPCKFRKLTSDFHELCFDKPES